MIEADSPKISVAGLMKKIKEEVARHQHSAIDQLDFPIADKLPVNHAASFGHIEALLNAANAKSQLRTELPTKLNRFPLNLSKKLRRLALKLYGFLFKEQRAVNFSLIQAVRELSAVNRYLVAQVMTMQAHLGETHSRLAYLEQMIAQTQAELTEPAKEDPGLDAFYVAFEDQFRGSREDILDRLKVYLPLLEETKIGDLSCPILDLGCGRGEWLELLRESGYVAVGVDLNRSMLEKCRSMQLDVIECDALLYLKTLPEQSLGAVTGFHIIEHLPFEALIQLFNEIFRVLQPGGLVILETPDPDNVLVGSNTFYLDPTHRNPLPNSMIKFMAESCGLDAVKIIKLHPFPDHVWITGSEIAERFSNYFYGPQDYAVVGFKP